MEPHEIEAQGVEAGLNPMFGRWAKQFGIAPITREATNEARKKFRAEVQSNLGTSFVFSGEIALSITLYLNEQKMVEESRYGDLDNHAKPLLDALKGVGGILVDDSQIQHLTASWIDTPREEYFEIEITGSPDEFLLLPVSLYEMPDKLFYPIPQIAWTPEGGQEIPAALARRQLELLAQTTSARRARRHELQLAGATKQSAFERTRQMSLVQMGFHKSKIVESGFDLVLLDQWRGD